MPEAKTKEQQAQEFLEAAARNYPKHLEHLRIQKVKWRVGQAHDADDVLQDAILKCYDKISQDGLSAGYHYFTYLNTAISNNFSRYHEQRQRNHEFSLDLALERMQDAEDGGPNQLVVEGLMRLTTAVDATAEARQDSDDAEAAHTKQLVAAFEQLPEKYQELLLMSMSNLRYKEICRVLGLKMGQVKMRFKSGRDLIKAQLGAQPKNEND